MFVVTFYMKFKNNHKKYNAMKKTLNVFLIAAIGGTCALGVNKYFEKANSTEYSQKTNSNIPVSLVSLPASPENAINFTSAADLSVHAVVHVKTSFEVDARQYGLYYYDPFHNFFGNGNPHQSIPQQTSGSGVIISKDGYIVTNNHVVDKAEKIEITLNDKRTYNAEIIGKDPTTDLALLKIKADDLPYLSYGNSDEVKVGEWVLAVGNPFNLTSTVTAGIVSAKGRNINILQHDPNSDLYPIESFIQTDAAVNPGNSGGALVNTSGQLIGVNAAIASNTGSYTGYSFAIPVNIVSKVMADLLEYGEVQRAFLGISIQDIDSKLADEKGLKETKGIFITGVSESGGAADAGLMEGDVVLKVGTVDVNNVSQLQEQIGTFRPGEKASITFRRGNDIKTVFVTLKNKNGTTAVIEKEKVVSMTALGASFQPISDDEKSKLKISNGLKIIKLNSGKLRSAGIKEGFIITSIDKKKVNTVEELKDILQNKSGGILLEGIYPNGMRAYYGFGL